MTPLPLTSQLNMDSDLLGLRSMLSGDPGGVSTSSSSNTSHSNSFLSSVSSSQMFGGLIGQEFKPGQIIKSASSSSLGKQNHCNSNHRVEVLMRGGPRNIGFRFKLGRSEKSTLIFALQF
jgi:hypothetical protein